MNKMYTSGHFGFGSPLMNLSYRLEDGTILEFKNLLKESSRTYYFPDGTHFTIKNAVRIAVRPTSHRIETVDGKRFIVPGKFIAIAIDSEGWSA